MKRFVPGMLVWLIVAAAAAQTHVRAVPSALSGTVRDAHGTPQMGAMIELLSADASVIATAYSDQYGRYLLPSIHPGKYELRATAAFFVPALKMNLRLQAGRQSIVNLTMTAMFEAANWLPAQRRQADEPVDDWKWTLRSTASRPLLRILEDDSPQISSSGEQPHRSSSEGRVLVMNGDGAFGDGGLHQSLMLDRTMEDGDGAALRAEIGNDMSPYSVGPSVVVSAGYERRTMLGGTTRLVTSVASHPELTDGNSTQGFQVLQMASAEGITLGDLVMVDFGTLLEAERLEQTRLESEPFARVTVHPTQDLVVQYRYASGRELQSSDDLDRLKPALTAMVDQNGRPMTTRGSHQEISISHQLDGGQVITAAVYSDRFDHVAIAGSGNLTREQLAQSMIVADPTTGTFNLAASGYSGHGLSLAAMQPLTPALSLWAEYDLGTALRNQGEASLADLSATVRPELTPAASVALRGKILKTGTSMKAEYRWQRRSTLTQVNAFNVMPDEAYLGFYLRQRIWAGRYLPQGIDAVVEATNLLEQGYQPVVSADGQTFFLAQVPRSVQGGLAFNF